MRYVFAVAIIAASVSMPPASAAENVPVPSHDVDHACATLKDRAMIANCVRDEQDRYDFIRSAWGDLSPERQRAAYAFSQDQSATNYAFYKSLALFVSAQIQMQQQAKDSAGPTPRFQR